MFRKIWEFLSLLFTNINPMCVIALPQHVLACFSHNVQKNSDFLV